MHSPLQLGPQQATVSRIGIIFNAQFSPLTIQRAKGPESIFVCRALHSPRNRMRLCKCAGTEVVEVAKIFHSRSE